MKLLLIASILAGVLVILIAFLLLIQPTDTIIIQAHVKVDDYVGMNLDSDKVYFGTVSPGSRGERRITIGAEKNRYAVISVAEPLKEWVIIQPDSVVFSGNKEIVFTAIVPLNASFGNYTAPVAIHFYHPFAKFLLP